MAHGIGNDIHPDLICNHTVLGGVARVVDPFPGVAEVTIAGEENHEPAVLIFNAYVMRRHATLS